MGRACALAVRIAGAEKPHEFKKALEKTFPLDGDRSAEMEIPDALRSPDMRKAR